MNLFSITELALKEEFLINPSNKCFWSKMSHSLSKTSTEHPTRLMVMKAGNTNKTQKSQIYVCKYFFSPIYFTSDIIFISYRLYLDATTQDIFPTFHRMERKKK